MSYITPDTYYDIAEKLASAYARMRDSFNDGVNADTAYKYASEAHILVVEATDDNTDGLDHGATRDPIGSISYDLGKKVYDFGTGFTETQAQTLAAAYFTNILTSLNTHVLNRTPLPDGVTRFTGIGHYYTTYANTDGVDEMSLFTNGTPGDGSSYFSPDFAELSTKINVTIDSGYVSS